MAEAVGLAIGVVSLVSLYSACVDFMDCVGKGRNCGKEFEVSMTRFILLEARLKAWGKSLRINQPGDELPALREQWEQEQTTIGRALIGIKDIFADCQSLERKYGLQEQEPQSDRQDIIEGEKASISLGSIERAFRSSAKSRQQGLPFWKKSVWAIRDSKKFDALISDLTFYIDNLEKLSDRLQVLSVQQMLVQVNINAITSQSGIKLLEEASAIPRAIENVEERTEPSTTLVTVNEQSKSIKRTGPSFQYGFSALRPVAKYVSRPALESKVRNQLNPSSLADDEEGRTLVVWGLGGSGKSQLMLNYIKNYRRDYEAVIWVQAGEKATIERDFIRIYRILFPENAGSADDKTIALDDAVFAVKEWFNRQERRSLLVIDSADSIENPEDASYIDLGFFTPDAPLVDTVITTRSSQAQMITSLEAVEVGGLTEAEACTLFRNYAKTLARDTQVEKEIVKIVTELGLLALAITLAGSHVAVTPRLKSNIALYLPEYNKNRKLLLSRKAVPNIHSYSHSVLSTWETSFNAMRQHDEFAARVLCQLAFLNFDEIFTELISAMPGFDCDPNDPIVSEETCKSEETGPRPNSLRCEEQPGDPVVKSSREKLDDIDTGHSEQAFDCEKTSSGSFTDNYRYASFKPLIFDRYDVELAFETLQKYSFLSLQGNGEAYTMHKLVHTWSYDRLEAEERRKGSLTVLQLLDQAVTMWESDTPILELRRYVPHITANWSTILKEAEKPNMLRRVDLERIFRTICVVAGTGSWNHLLRVTEHATRGAEELLGLNNPLTLILKYFLAETFFNRGMYKDAEAACRQMLKEQERDLHRDHTDILLTKTLLASSLYNSGRWEAAMVVVRQVIKAKQKLYGNEHPETIRSMSELAIMVPDPDDAEEICQQGLAAARKIGWEGRGVQQIKKTLGLIMMSRNRYDEAEELLESAFNGLRSLLGEDHLDALACTRLLVSLAFRSTGRYDVVSGKYEEIYERLKGKFGLENPLVLDHMLRYAVALHSQGQRQEAIEMAKECLQLRRQAHGDQHKAIEESARWLDLWQRIGDDPAWPHEYESVRTDRLTEPGIRPDYNDQIDYFVMCMSYERKSDESEC